MVLLAAAPLGPGADGGLGLALLGALAMAVVLSRFSFPLRGRALLWLARRHSDPAARALARARAAAGALAGYAFFTVFFWGTLYYRLRTGAPWTNFTRFWRLVLTNSDPTSGNALEQVPKLVMALSAGGAAGGGARRRQRGSDRRRGADRGRSGRDRLAPLPAHPAARLPAAPCSPPGARPARAGACT